MNGYLEASFYRFPMPPYGATPYLKMKLPYLKNNPPPHLKVKPPCRKWFLEKKPKKSETVISSVSIIKQHWKKMAEIPQKSDFLTWSIQNFVKKVKQFVRKYYIT